MFSALRVALAELVICLLPVSGVFCSPFQTASVSGLSLKLLFVFVRQAERLNRPVTRRPLAWCLLSTDFY